MSTTMTPPAATAALIEAVGYIAGRCDGAYAADAQGFNGSDTGFGKWLATQPAHAWTPEMAASAHEMLAKYSGQLAQGGIDFAAVPVPPKIKGARGQAQTQRAKERQTSYAQEKQAARAALRRVAFDGEHFAVVMPDYVKAIVDALKAVPGRRWNGTANLIPAKPHSAAALQEVVAEYGFRMAPEVEAELAALAEAALTEEEPPVGSVALHGKELRATFEYAKETVAAFKTAGWRWQNEHRYWRTTVTPATAGKVLAHLASLQGFAIAPGVLAAVEQAAGDAATLASAATAHDADITIEGLGAELRNFQRAGVAYALKTRRTFIADEMGCIDGDAVVHLNRAGKGFRLTLAEAHRRFHSGRWDAGIPTKARAMVDGQLRQHEVVDILDQGVKATVAVTFESGKRLVCTPDHELAVPGGEWEAAGGLLPGATVVGNGNAGCRVDRWGNPSPFTPTVEIVVSVEPAGERRVYDMVMADPHRNFVADGIVVHNCGKTPMALAAIHAADAYPAVVVCPASLKLVWRNHIRGPLPYAKQGWLPGKKVVVLDGVTPDAWRANKADIVVVNFDVLHAWLPVLMKLKARALVIDESHYCKDMGTKKKPVRRTVAVRDLARTVPHDGLVLAMSGTPVVNRPKELVAQLDILGRLDEFGGSFGFLRRFCGAYKDQWGKWQMDGSSNEQELNERLRATCWVRRLKVDVLSELPPKQWSTVPVTLSNPGEYARVEADVIAWLRDQVAADEEVTAATEGMSPAERKAYIAKAQADAATKALRAERLVQLNKLRQVAALGKIPAAKEWVKEFLTSGKKLVLFAEHRAVQKALAKEFPGCATVMGDDSMAARQASVERFQTDPACRLIVCSLRAAREGLTMTAASDVAFIELGWTPGGLAQAEDRCIADGQRVHTRRGFLPVEDVVEGDLVLTQGGTWNRVTATHRREHVGPATAITYVRYTDPLVCTPDHRVLVRRDGGVRWVEAQDVRRGDFLVMPRPRAGAVVEEIAVPESCRLGMQHSGALVPAADAARLVEEHGGIRQAAVALGVSRMTVSRALRREGDDRVPNGRAFKLADSYPLDDEMLHAIGWYLAEGCAITSPGKGRCLSFSGHRDEVPVLERIRDLFAGFGLGTAIRLDKNSLGAELRVYSAELARWWGGWLGDGSYTVRIPVELQDLPAEQARVLLDAYIAGDGYERGRKREFVGVSPALVVGMTELALRLGYAPIVRRIRGVNEGQWVGGFTVDGKPDNPALAQWDDDYVYQPVRAVETHDFDGYVNDLTVEGDPSFVVGQATVHNCHRLGQDADVVTVHRLLAEGTIDEEMEAMLNEKAAVLAAVSDGKSSVAAVSVLNDVVGALLTKEA